MDKYLFKKVYGERAIQVLNFFIKKIYANNYSFDDKARAIYLYNTIDGINVKRVKLLIAKSCNGIDNIDQYKNLKEIVKEKLKK